MKQNIGTAIILVVLFLTSTIGGVDGAVNLISNPGFESGTASWGFYTSGAGTFTAVTPGHEGSNAARLALGGSGNGTALNIQLYQTGVTLEANTRYRLSFWAYSSTGHDMTLRLLKHASPYSTYMPEYTANLGTGWLNFTHEFNSTGFSGTASDGRVMFWFTPFVTAGDIYYIDDIRLEKVEVEISPPIVTGNTPTGTGVPVNTQITVTFNESMNQSSAQSALSTSPTTNGGFVWSGNMMTYTPGSSLSAGTTYTVIIGTGAKDLAGNSLQSYSWSFTTSGGSSSIEARLAALEADMTDLKTRVTTLETENTALKNVLAGVTRNGNDIYIDGANLHIRDGSGDTTGPVNGLGNLIIGYNELRAGGNIRTGSHNLVIGYSNNYASYGGLVAGRWNAIYGNYSSISGGSWNTASSDFSSVSGGNSNTASGVHSSISGGSWNTASSDFSSVSGGNSNTASGTRSSISGGGSNIASSDLSSVSGGSRNTASGGSSSVSGGSWNSASGTGSSVSGGNFNTAGGSRSSVSGGSYNIAGDYIFSVASSVSGGSNNTASGDYSSVSGGYQRTAIGDYNWTAGYLSQDR